MNIVALDDYQDAFRSTSHYGRLKEHKVTVYTDPEKDPDRSGSRVADADIVILTQQRTRFPRSVIEKATKLKFISQTGRNTSHIDMEACNERRILVSAVAGGQPYSTVELTWGLIIAALRHVPYEIARLKAGYWQSTMGVRLQGRTLGIYAYGRIGSLVARVGQAFGMKVVCWGREGSTMRAKADGYDVAANRDAFFSECDVISLHLPLNESTRGIVTADDLARMKPTALFVNTSRAPIIAEGALAQALKNGHPGFGAVDVFENEPVLGGNHPLLHLQNAICTPHLGYVTAETLEVHYRDAVNQILAFVSGKPINAVNPVVLAGG